MILASKRKMKLHGRHTGKEGPAWGAVKKKEISFFNLVSRMLLDQANAVSVTQTAWGRGDEKQKISFPREARNQCMLFS